MESFLSCVSSWKAPDGTHCVVLQTKNPLSPGAIMTMEVQHRILDSSGALDVHQPLVVDLQAEAYQEEAPEQCPSSPQRSFSHTLSLSVPAPAHPSLNELHSSRHDLIWLYSLIVPCHERRGGGSVRRQSFRRWGQRRGYVVTVSAPHIYAYKPPVSPSCSRSAFMLPEKCHEFVAKYKASHVGKEAALRCLCATCVAPTEPHENWAHARRPSLEPPQQQQPTTDQPSQHPWTIPIQLDLDLICSREQCADTIHGQSTPWQGHS